MKFNIIALFVFLINGLSYSAYCQVTKSTPKYLKKDVVWESYEVLDDGDTINKTDTRQRKHGKWLHSSAESRGEEVYVEFGQYKDDRRINFWRKFTKRGELISVENFKKGRLDGEAKYYEDGKLFCVGNFLALKEQGTFDTILVEDPITGEQKPVIVRCEVGSVRHGIWTYYDTRTSKIQKIVEYHVDQVVYEKAYLSSQDSVVVKRKWKKLPSEKYFDSERIWYVNKNNKQVNYVDLPERVVYRKR